MDHYRPNFGPKITDPSNLQSALKIFSKFYTVKVENGYMKTILLIFPKKILIYGQMGQTRHNLAQKIMYSYNAESVSGNLGSFHSEGNKKYMNAILLIFLKKFLFGVNRSFRAQFDLKHDRC